MGANLPTPDRTCQPACLNCELATGKSSEAVGEEAANALIEADRAGGCVDEYGAVPFARTCAQGALKADIGRAGGRIRAFQAPAGSADCVHGAGGRCVPDPDRSALTSHRDGHSRRSAPHQGMGV